jgi:hypothetical protein
MLTSICDIKVGMYILYQNLIHKITDSIKYKNYFQINMEGIYLKNTVVKLTLANNTQLDVINPNCIDYDVVQWLNNNNFCLTNGDISINHNIENNVTDIIYKLMSNKKVKVKICTYENIEGMILI